MGDFNLPNIDGENNVIHHIIQSSLTVGRPAFPRENISYRQIRSIDNAAFALDLMATELLQHTCVTLHGLVDQYNSTPSRLLDEYAPLKTKMLTIRPDAPWINTDILEAIKVRRQLERHWRSTRLTVDTDRFKEQRQTVKKMIFTAKSLFHTAQINEHSTDLKSLFRVTRSGTCNFFQVTGQIATLQWSRGPGNGTHEG